MDKISGIIPASNRVTTVDMKSSGVARPGTPSFGREVGVSHLAGRNEMVNASGRAQEEFSQQMTLRQPNKDPKAEIVQSMADKFFIRKAQENDMPDFKPSEMNEQEMNIAQQQIARVRDDVPIKTNLNLRAEAAAAADASEQPVVGHYLDVRA